MKQLKLFEPIDVCKECSMYTEGFTQNGRTYKCRFEAICMIITKQKEEE